MLTECVMFVWTPVPLIVVNCHVGLWRIIIGVMGMPAHAFIVANNFGGCIYLRTRQEPCSYNSTGNDLTYKIHHLLIKADANNN